MISLAYIGVTDFWEKTPREVYIEATAKAKLLKDQERARWEQTRLIMWSCLIPHHDSKKGQLKITDVIKFDFDRDENEVGFVSMEERKQIQEIFKGWKSTDGRPILSAKEYKDGKDNR